MIYTSKQTNASAFVHCANSFVQFGQPLKLRLFGFLIVQIRINDKVCSHTASLVRTLAKKLILYNSSPNYFLPNVLLQYRHFFINYIYGNTHTEKSELENFIDFFKNFNRTVLGRKKFK